MASSEEDQELEEGLLSDSSATQVEPGAGDERNLASPGSRSLSLDLDAETAATATKSPSSRLVFSPGGSEAYVFTRAEVLSEGGTTATTPSSVAPREIHDPIFVEKPWGERPATVGQSSEDGLRRLALISSKPVPSVSSLQVRMDDLRLSLDKDISPRGSSTAESSPRISAPSGGARRALPALPALPVPPREKFLQDPDGFVLSLDLPTSPGGGGAPIAAGHDRASSPSLASVLSAASSTASGMLSGRRNLEWDSGADLGYDGSVRPQEDAAASLSTLEKLAIGNYSTYLRSEPEGTPAKERSNRAKLAAAAAQKNEHEMRQMRLHKFADSLMRQRELRNMSGKNPVQHQSGRRHRSRSRDSSKKGGGGSSKSDTTPDNSPCRRHDVRRQRHYGSPMKSTSLTDLTSKKVVGPRHLRSNSEVFANFLPQGLITSSEPSSYSSTGTVIPIPAAGEAEETFALQAGVNERGSLSSHLLGLFQTPSTALSDGGSQHLEAEVRSLMGSKSQASLSSRRSGSRSFETVIDLGKRTKYRTRENLLQVESTEDNESAYFEKDRSRQRAYNKREQQPPKVPEAAWVDREELSRHLSQTSSVVTTSDDEKMPEKAHTEDEERLMQLPPTNSSTMESAQIDRAKSFEYFPGESFPLQENSSSYEYLPGHMVSDRPGTVVSNYHNDYCDAEEDGGQAVSGVTSLSESNSSDFTAAQKSGARRKIRLKDDPSSGAAIPIMKDTDLEHISEELNEHSRELLEAHLKRTRRFYRKVKKYLTFLAEPSETEKDDLRKQQAFSRLLAIVGEDKVDSPSLGQALRQLADTTEESDLTQSSEQPTKQVEEKEHERQQRRRKRQEERRHHDVSSSSQATNEEEDSTKAISSLKESTAGNMDKKTVVADKFHLHRQRILQMKVLRKEIKKLERLETAHLQNMFGSRDLLSDTDNSSVISSTLGKSKPHLQRSRSTQVDTGKDQLILKKDKEKLQQQHHLKGGQKAVRRSLHMDSTVTKTRTVQVTSQGPGLSLKAGAVHRGSKDDIRREAAKVSKVPPPKRSEGTNGSARMEFGQTYPTPRDNPDDVSVKKSKAVQTTTVVVVPKAKKRYPVERRKPPVAYYLPLDRDSAVQVGAEVIRSKEEKVGASKENRSILANWDAAGVDVAEISSRKEGDKKADNKEQKRGQMYTLKDALSLRRPCFLAEAERRRQVLRQMRQQRLANEEERRRWAERVAAMPAKGRARHRDEELPQTRVVRLFNWREMVQQTRLRYKQLPEFRHRVNEAKRQASFRTNRILGEVYKKRLQENVLRGNVSLSPHKNVLGP